MIKYEINEREVTVLKTELDDGAVYVLSASYNDTNEQLTDYDLQKLEVIYQSELFADKMSECVDASSALAF